ncbi:MAG TPA: Lrp/AsnC family transcriptional regulator [Steroidobacteraceae bacterium]|nr:Lrp/AsnC family transcriptional regulator [Steroidobacteraceae bacterium]HRX87993.1 Lrp/AsnC family transcriptional regulator [Steroidobacteraceae bacterium]
MISSNITLDKTDVRILELLQKDGRIAIVDLARQVGLSPTPCARRVRLLETNGVIENYTAIIDPRKVGQGLQAMVQIKLEQHTDELIERFRREMLDRPEVLACYAMAGEMDFLLHVVARDIDAMSQFTLHKLLRMPGVRDVRSSIVLQTLKHSVKVPLRPA